MVTMSRMAMAQAPSLELVRMAEEAAGHQHAMINLLRLVQGLDKRIPDNGPDDSPLQVTGSQAAQVKRLRSDWKSVQYARALCGALKSANEGSSSAGAQLKALSNTIDLLMVRCRLSMEAITDISGPESVSAPATRPAAVSTQAQSAEPQSASSAAGTIAQASTTRRRRPVPSLSDYLASRQRHSLRGGEAGLLSLGGAGAENLAQAKSRGSQRDELLAGRRSEGVVGNAQLHDELGGQLAEMSHRLKLNAIHFANSMEEEKSLLDSSQQVLEKNLSSTQSSKKQLGAVTRKGRGTTCMTLGIVALVLVLFIWTYMLIRFT